MDEKRYLKRKEKARSDGNFEQMAISCNNLGDYYNQEGQYEKAVKEYLEEASLYAKLGKKLEMAKAHRMCGEMFMLRCDFDKALEHINIYLKCSKNLNNKVEEQRAYATLGRAHLLHGQSTSESSATTTLEQLKLAEKSFLKSLLLIKEITGQITKLEQLDMQARCYLNIGVVKEHMEEFEESIAYIDRAIKICKAHELFELTHLCYISMSLLYHCKKNDATHALRFCNLALEVAKRLPNKVQKICETLITKAEILIKAGDFASSKQILTKAYKKNSPNANDRLTIEKMLRIVITICNTLDELVTTSSLDYGKCKELYEKLGDGCCHLNNYAKALEYYRKMLECAEKNGDTEKTLAPIYVSLYQTYKDNNEYDKALEFLWKEYEINRDISIEAFSTLCSIAEICELQNQSFWTIQDLYQKAKLHAEKITEKNVRKKLEKIVFMRMKKLQLKHKMHTLLEILEQDAANQGIDLNDDKEESDDDEESEELEHNTPELGADICSDDLTDSDTSDLDETDKQRIHRTTRGTRTLTIKRNNKGETQLHQACIAGNLELVKRLLDQGHIVNVRDHAGWLPLHEACNHGFCDIVELLLDRGAVVAINDKGGTSCDGITPLYDACVNGFLDVVELLLERGADATVKTDFGETCVNGLDKWRRSATLTTGEQAHYHQVRTTLLRPLAKVGIVGKTTLVNGTGSEALKEKNNNNKKNDDDDDIETALLSANEDDDSEDEDSNEPTTYSSSLSRQRQRINSESERILKDINKPSKKATASAEYRNVMEQLKHPNRNKVDDEIYGTLPSSSSSCSSSTHYNNPKQKRNALLHSEEIDDNDWLIDDMGPEKKKRRFLTTPTKQDIQQQQQQQRIIANTSIERINISKENLYDSNYTTTNSIDGIELNNDLDAFQIMQDAAAASITTTTTTTKRSFNKSRSSSIGSTNTSCLSLSKRNKFKKQQSSLFDSGFCRFRSESPNSIEDDLNYGGLINVSTGPEPDSTTAGTASTTSTTATAIHLVISPAKTSSPIQLHATSQLVPTTISFKIKVEDELLLVPIERKKLNDINMRWLAEEASRRYYNSTGLKPLLRLKTADGFAYEENDSVSIAVEQNMILASVLEWKIAPLAQRYEEMCHQLKKEILIEVQRSLERAQASNSLELTNFWLNSQSTEPIFKALLHQTQLRILDLSNNFIQNEGCRQLSKAINTLKQLKILNLSGNFITSSGLEILLLNTTTTTTTTTSNQNENSIKLIELEELNISQNPLGNDCLRILDKFCKRTENTFEKLLISQCGLTNLYDYDLNFYKLIKLDISFNQLKNSSRKCLLEKLNSCRMQYLNLNYVYEENNDDDDHDDDNIGMDTAEDFVKFFENGTCDKFKRIELSGCNLNDMHIYRIVQCLKKSNSLELLDLTGNKKLTPCSFQYIIDEIPQLRKLLATNCLRFIDNERIQKLSQCKQIPNLLCLTLDGIAVEDEDENEDNNVQRSSAIAMKEELFKIWCTHWNDKAKVSIYGSNLIFYTNDKDLI